MSTETLKFFEEKTTEEIINWMLSNLSEDQIRMCLDQSGIPDTSVIEGKRPIAAAAAGSGPIQTVTLPDGTQKQLQPGEGSSTDPLPTITPSQDKPKKDVTKIFLDKYRKKCNGTGYIIKSVSKEGVEYFEFKEIEEGDNVISVGVSMGEVGWIKNKVPTSEFKEFCTDEDREIFEFLKEENMETFLSAPAEVIETAADYPSSGLISPIPIAAAAAAVDLTPEPTPVVEAGIAITEPMLKALKIQQGTSAFIQETYPNLFSRGLTMFPVFVYGSEGDLVLHLTTVVSDGKLALIQESTNKRLLNSKFKKIIASIQTAIESGLYTPSGDMQQELNEAQKDVSADITTKISKIYDPIKLKGFTYFGTLEDEEPDWLRAADQEVLPDSQGSFENINSQDFNEDVILLPEMEGDSSPVEKFNMMDLSDVSSKPTVGKKKKVSEMSIPEIEEHMRITFGEQYLKEYKPEKYVNSLGVTNVRYVKRPNCPPKEEWDIVTERPIFAEFQGKPSVNSGPGRFGETDTDSDEELLFD